MTNDEMDELLIKIEETDPNEQLILAAKLIEELTVNNKFFDEYEYELEKSEEYVKSMSTLSQKLKAKIEIQKINSLIKRFNKLKKIDQKLVIEDILKIISDLEKKLFAPMCPELEHSFTNWEQYYDVISTIKKDDSGERKIIEIRIPYWTRKCIRCGFKQIVEKEPSYLIQKRNKEMIKKRKKALKEELALLDELE